MTGSLTVSGSAVAPNMASRFCGRVQRVIHHQAAPDTAAPANRPHRGEAKPTGTRSRVSGFAAVSWSGAKDMVISCSDCAMQHITPSDLASAKHP